MPNELMSVAGSVFWIANVAGSFIALVDFLKTKRKGSLYVAILIVVAAIFNFISTNYVPVPKVDGLNYELAKNRLYESGLLFNIDKVNLDDPNSDISFLVASQSIDEGQYVKRKTEISLLVYFPQQVSLSSRENSSDLNKKSDEISGSIILPDTSGKVLEPTHEMKLNSELDNAELSPTIDVASLQSRNSNSISLFVGAETILFSPQNGDKSIVSGGNIGAHVDIKANIHLIDYLTKQVVDQKAISGRNNTAEFTNIEPGVYYFKVIAPGYKTYVVDAPFKLDYDTSQKILELPWIVNLVPENVEYLHEFTVQIVDEFGKGIDDLEVMITPAVNEETFGNTYELFITKENGIICRWTAIDQRDFYEPMVFRYRTGASLIVVANNKEIGRVNTQNLKTNVILILQ